MILGALPVSARAFSEAAFVSGCPLSAADGAAAAPHSRRTAHPRVRHASAFRGDRPHCAGRNFGHAGGFGGGQFGGGHFVGGNVGHVGGLGGGQFGGGRFVGGNVGHVGGFGGGQFGGGHFVGGKVGHV